ncbi:MAG: RNA methyltransferase [Terriglobales bacterium]
MTVQIVLVRPRNPLNLGAAARAMANFGLSELVLVAPYGEAWRSARSARAGAAVLEQARTVGTLAEAIAGCGHIVGTTTGTARQPEVPLEDWRQVAAELPQGRTALLFGSEKTGLNVEDISHCHRLARIPTVTGAPSMNLGQAVAVCAYELARQRPLLLGRRREAAIGPRTRERLIETWYPLMERVGAVKPGHQASQGRVLRQALLRWGCTAADDRRLLGLARQIRHHLDGRGES